MNKLFISLALLLSANFCSAEYNDNKIRKITAVLTYTDSDSIYIQLENPPAHSTCDNQFFVIPDSLPTERRQILLSRILLAYSTQEAVNIGFDNAGNCVSSYVRIHRVG